MKHPAVKASPVASALDKQKSDFTAEGSPPPGKVSTVTPASAPEPVEPRTVPASVHGTIRRRRERGPVNP